MMDISTILDTQAGVLLAAAYLIGSIPFGLLLGKFVAKKDVRREGSGNIGATNVFRTSGKTLGILTFALDGIKGFVAVLLMRYMHLDQIYAAGALVVIGHMFPLWLRFRGGKGVSTYIGVLLALDVTVAGIMIAIWAGMILLTRLVSIASLVASLAVPISVWFFGNDIFLWMACLVTALIWVRHASNIKRLFQGKELKPSR